MPENTEKTVKDTEQAVKAEKPAKTEKSDKKENKKEMYLSAFSRTQASSFAMSKTRSKKLCGQPQSLCLKTQVLSW